MHKNAIAELLEEKHLLISKHTRKYLREEHYFTGPVINRANKARWINEGAKSLEERAHTEVERLLNNYSESTLDKNIKNEIIKLMETEAGKFGIDKLPERTA